MSYARRRSMTGDLNEGLTDGSYKKVIQGRGGIPEYTTAKSRHHLADTWFGIHMDNEQVDPFGRVLPELPGYVPTRPVHYPGG